MVLETNEQEQKDEREVKGFEEEELVLSTAKNSHQDYQDRVLNATLLAQKEVQSVRKNIDEVEESHNVEQVTAAQIKQMLNDFE